MPTLVPVGNYGGHSASSLITPMLITPYSVLSIPAFKAAVEFLAKNLASFGRSVHKDGSPAETKHPLDKLLRRRPNGYQNSFTFWYTLFGHTFHRGNGYAQIERDGTFRPKALNNLLPEDTYPCRLEIDGKVEQFYVHRPTRTVLPGDDVLHFRAGISHDGMCGIDPAELFCRVFERANTLDQFQTRYLRNGTVIRGAIQFPTGVTKEQAEEAVALLNMYYQINDPQRDVLVLSDGATLNNTTITPKDSELGKQESNLTKQIAQIMSVPPQFLYEFSESKYNNAIEAMGQEVVRYTFRPLIEQIEDELDCKLLNEREQDNGYEIKINPNALLRGSTKEQEDLVAASVNAGIRSRNEGRLLLGLPADKDPESDKLKTLGDTAAPATQTEKTNEPAPPTPPTQEEDDDEEFSAKPFSVLAKVIEATCARVDRKSAKGLETYSKKSGDERTRIVNVFAEQQAKYAADELAPLSETIVAMGGEALPVEEIAEKYAASIRKGSPLALRDLLDKSNG